jgi:hypothetical protein
MRRNTMLPIGTLLPGLPAFNGGKTYAAWPVWSGSVCGEARFAPMPKKRALRLYHQARAWNRQKRAGRYGGGIGGAALRVLECLIFDFMNFATGRLDPSYMAIARKTGLGRSSVAEALARLKELGIVTWLRRCTESRDGAGRFMLRQDTNAYGVLPPSQWRGYVAPPEPEPPHPSSWGAAPSLACLVDQAMTDQRDGASVPALLARLDADPGDGLAAQLAAFGRAMHSPQF